ncbi:hypothetical protein ACQP1P_21990 [Dactylosporangium sp. CA-052675]|uniref:hypothetical protein n=1 Tax=Dactylosporangium sp. CA-052675 TaxID=3239927 RepID=UPI003D8FC837
MSENPFTILTREPVPDSRVDEHAVIARGRARVRRRRALSAAGAGLAVAVVIGAVALAQPRPQPRPTPVGPTPSPSVSACGVEPLPALGPTAWVVVDGSGRYIAASQATGDMPVVVSGPGGTRTFTAVPRIFVTGVNGSGTVVGNVENDSDADGYVIDGGTTVALGRPKGALNVRAQAVNDTGDVVGDARMPGNTFHAVVWRHGQWSRPQLLPTPDGEQSSAYGIAADGRIVGSVGAMPQPYLWSPDGTARPLPPPTGKPGGMAVDIVGDWAAGPVDYVANSVPRPNGRRYSRAPLTWARWNLRTGQVVPIQENPLSTGTAGLLADGTVVLLDIHSVTLWTETGATPLPTPEGSGRWEVTGASERGTLVGTVVDGERRAAFRWACR